MITRSFGITPGRASDQLQRDSGAPATAAMPLPAGAPGRVSAAAVGITEAADGVRFVVLGDSGGIMDAKPQNAVAAAVAQAHAQKPCDFAYHVGDLVYFNGDPDQWAPQFYEPYCHALGGVPIVGIPGNHDGDASDGVAGSGISSFMANMCTKAPSVPPGDPQLEYQRHTQTQPYCDWTLALESVWIIGVWSNVPSGGALASSQVAWLTEELRSAPADVSVILALHHPPYSVDAHHGGSARMGTAIDGACVAAGRWPSLVLSGHVHDYQRFTRRRSASNTPNPVTYVVQGNSGYHNRHQFAADAKPGEQVSPSVTFEAGYVDAWGFLLVDITAGQITGTAVGVDETGATTVRDTFTISTGVTRPQSHGGA